MPILTAEGRPSGREFPVNLAGAILKGADFRGADLRGAVLDGADLTESNLCSTDLRGARWQQATLTGAARIGCRTN